MSTTTRNFQPSSAAQITITAVRNSSPRVLLRLHAYGNQASVLSDLTPREALLLSRMLSEACKDVADLV